MSILKRVIAVISTTVLAVTGLTGLETSASATGTSAFYMTSINNGGAGSKARDYVTLGDKIYFVATSEGHGNAIFSTSKQNPAGATFVYSNAVSPKSGDIRNLFGLNDYLFYVDNTKNSWTYTVYAYKISTGTNTKLLSSNNGEFLEEYGNRFNFVARGGKVYFIAKDSQDPSVSDHDQVSNASEMQLWSFDTTTGIVANVDPLAFDPKTADRGYSAQGMNTGPNAISVINNKLYIPTAESGWWTGDQKINIFNPANNSWTSASLNGSDLTGISPTGNFYYNGNEILVVNKSLGNSQVGYYAIDGNGVATRLGTWSAQYESAMFVNYGERLMVSNGNHFYEVSTSTGELVEETGFIPAGANGVELGSIVETNGVLMMIARLTYAVTPTPEPVQKVYKWTGTGSITQVGNIVPAANGSWLSNWPTLNGNSAIAQLGAFPGGVILDAYLSTTDGFEPYVVKFDGTTTLLANIADVPEGSGPNIGCGGSTPTADYIPAQTVDVNGTHNVISEFKTVNGVLQYSVFQIPGANSFCSFMGDGTTTFYTAWDTTIYNYAIYKLNADHTSTRLIDMGDRPSNVFMYGGNYYYRLNDNFWKITPTGTATQITGTGSDGIWQNSIRESVQVGNKLFVTGQDNGQNYGVFSYDLDHPELPVVSYWLQGSQDGLTEASYLHKIGTKVIFTAVPYSNADYSNQSGDNAWTGYQVYSVDSTNNNPAVKVFDINPDNTISDTLRDLFVYGNDIYIISGDDNSSSVRNLFHGSITSTSTTKLTLPATGFSRLSCVASVGGRLVIADNQSSVIYYDDSTAFPIKTGNSYALCEGYTSSQGMYFAADSTEMALNFGENLVYYGPSVPQAVSRMGQAVTEQPAKAIGGSTSSVDPDDVNLDNLDESLNFNGYFGSIDFPDGSGFTIDAKGNVKAKTKSIYLVQASGKIKFTYNVGSKVKVFSCNIKTFGSKKKVKRAFTAKKLYTSAKVCKLPAAAISAMKTSTITILQTLKVKRYYSTTMKAKTPAGAVIKVQNRKMTVRMGRIN